MKLNSRLKKIILIAAAAFLTLSITMVYIFKSYGFDFLTNSTPEQIAHKKCLKQMSRQTCKLMYGQDIGGTNSIKTYHIAGFGIADANVYQSLKATGSGMCQSMKLACDRSVSDPTCVLAVNLFMDMN